MKIEIPYILTEKGKQCANGHGKWTLEFLHYRILINMCKFEHYKKLTYTQIINNLEDHYHVSKIESILNHSKVGLDAAVKDGYLRH